MRLKIEQGDASGKMVFEAEDVSASPTHASWRQASIVVMVRDFSDAHHARRSHRLDRSERRRQDDAAAAAARRARRRRRGEVRRGANVQVAYYDQQREQLDPDRTVVDTIGDGSDTVTVNGQPRHVHGYLQDFLFSPERARSPVRALSGGERNRLLLARLLTRPANVLVLDEPTNDLDLETLELLEQQLVDWPGTLLLVSHDRRFLDNVVTSTLAFEGDGRVEEYVGGYEDYVRQRAAESRNERAGSRRRTRREMPKASVAKDIGARRSARSKKSASTRSCPNALRRSKPSRSSCRRRSPIPTSTSRAAR